MLRGIPINLLLQGGPYITANMYCICLRKHEQMPYRFAVIYETLRKRGQRLKTELHNPDTPLDAIIIL